jgi:hypothetical protein
MNINNYLEKYSKIKSLQKGIDQKMFGWLYVLLDYSYPGEIEENVDEIVRVLKDSYEYNVRTNPQLSKEYISEMIYLQKIHDYYKIALIMKNERINNDEKIL